MASLAAKSRHLTPGDDSGCKDHTASDEEPSPTVTAEVEALETARNDDSVECRLLALAPELRNRIYEYALIEEENIKIQYDCRKNLVQPSLTQVNRQIRDETLSMFYRQNDFEIRPLFSVYVKYACDSYVHARDRGHHNAEFWLGDAFAIGQGNHSSMTSMMELARKWLREIGKKNQELIGELLVSCPVQNREVNGKVLHIMASARFDFESNKVLETDADPLLEGWEWHGELPDIGPGDIPVGSRELRKLVFKAR